MISEKEKNLAQMESKINEMQQKTFETIFKDNDSFVRFMAEYTTIINLLKELKLGYAGIALSWAVAKIIYEATNREILPTQYISKSD